MERPFASGSTPRDSGPKSPFPEDIPSAASLIAMPACSRSPSRPFRPSSRSTPLTRAAATLMRYTVANLSAAPIEVRLAGWLENGVCLKSRTAYDGRLVNRALRADGLAMVVSSAEASKAPAGRASRSSSMISRVRTTASGPSKARHLAKPGARHAAVAARGERICRQGARQYVPGQGRAARKTDLA